MFFAFLRFVVIIALTSSVLIIPSYCCADPVIKSLNFFDSQKTVKIAGAIIRREEAYYSLDIVLPQTMSLRLSSLEHNAVFYLYDPGAKFVKDDDSIDGVSLVGETEKGAGDGNNATQWAGKLTKTGTYIIVVCTKRGNASYHLKISHPK